MHYLNLFTPVKIFYCTSFKHFLLSLPILDKISRKQNGDSSHDSNSSHENSFEMMKSGYFPKVNSIGKISDPMQEYNSSFASSYMSGMS